MDIIEKYLTAAIIEIRRTGKVAPELEHAYNLLKEGKEEEAEREVTRILFENVEKLKVH